MLPRTDLIVSYKPLPHVARSAIIKKHCFNYFCTGNRGRLLYVGNWNPGAGNFYRYQRSRKLQKIKSAKMSLHRSIWSMYTTKFSKNAKVHKDQLSPLGKIGPPCCQYLYAMGAIPTAGIHVFIIKD